MFGFHKASLGLSFSSGYNQSWLIAFKQIKFMKKHILISFALVALLLEVGFGVYIAFERKYESALNSLNLPIDSVREIQTDNGRELEIAALLPAGDSFIDTQVVVAQKKTSDRSINTNSPAGKVVPSSSASSRSSRSVAKTGLSKGLVAVKVIENREVPATNFVAKKELPSTENKSFIAKTQTILKKPFGWIKAIGSKLR